MKLTSDLQVNGHELRRARFEEGTTIPADPFLGQLFHLHVPGSISKIFYFDGAQWICGVTSIAGRQGDVVLSNVDVGLSLVENLKYQPWSQVLTDISNDLTTPPADEVIVGVSSEQIRTADEKIRGHHPGGGVHYLQRGVDGRYRWVDSIAQGTINGVLDLTPASDAAPLDIIQRRPLLGPGGIVIGGTWENRTPAQYKVDLTIDQVDNTRDADKPVSTPQLNAMTTRSTADRARTNHTGTQLAATISDFTAAADARIALQKGAANGVATLGADQKIPSSQLPPLAITSTYVVNSQTSQLALVAQEGDIAVRTDLHRTYAKNAGVTGTMTDWSELETPTDLVLSVNGMTGAVVVTKTHVGLDQVNNTSDMNKPVSTAQAAAIAQAVAASEARVQKKSFLLPALTKGQTYTYTHNLNSFDILVGFQDTSTHDGARLNYRAATLNTVEISVDVSIAANAIRVVVMS